MTVRGVLLVEGIANAIVLTAKTAVGLSTGSIAVLGDAVHSLTDIANNCVAFMVAGRSTEPPDVEHPYGHRKFESLAVFGLATLLTVIAVEVAIHAIGRIGEPVELSRWGLAMMLGVLAVNVGIATWERRWAHRLDSDLLRADAVHTLGDVLTTVAVIAGWQLAGRGHAWLDTTFALLMACLVFYLALGLFRRTIPVLVDSAGADPGALAAAVGHVGSVRAVRRVRSRQTGSGIAADVVVAVDGGLSIEESHAVCDTIERALRDRFGIADVTVHVEPG
jgi:cation diffusion facilitator family transporter